jgi:hemerythrin-like domain-containing protein
VTATTTAPATPDLTSYHAGHTALRRGTRALARAAAELDPGDRRRSKAFARYWKGYEGEVHAHHTIEDDVFFPVLVERVPVAAELIGRTDADHARLDELMTLVGGAVADLAAGRPSPVLVDGLRELADLMDAHLGFEDADILPLFERHFTAEEYTDLDDQAAKALGISKQAAFTVPFIASMLDPDVLDQVFGDAPVAFRLLLRATRRSHARLATRALGPVVLHQEVAA